MSELFSALREPEDQPKPDPALIRGRGDRIRRRRRTLQTVGAATACALVIGAVAFAGELTSPRAEAPFADHPSAPSTPDATPSPESTGLPADLPLTDGWVADPDLEGVIVTGDKVERVFPCDPPTLPDPQARQAAQLNSLADYRVREAAAYAGAEQAKRVATWIKQAQQHCPDGEFGGPIVWSVSNLAVGEDAFTLKGVYETANGVSVDSFVVVRFGAVLVIASDGSEGDASTLDGRIARDVEQLRPVFAALCAESDVCGRRQEPPPPASLTPDAKAVPAPVDRSRVLSAAQITKAYPLSGSAIWSKVPDSSYPTISCQSGYLRELGTSSTAFAEYDRQDPETTSPMAHVATTVLDYADRAAADAAMDELRLWLDDCTDTLPSKHPIINRGEFLTDTNEAGDLFRRDTTARAPEVCSGGCDSGWVEQQGIARVGERTLLVVSVGFHADLQLETPDNLDPLMLAAIPSAAP